MIEMHPCAIIVARRVRPARRMRERVSLPPGGIAEIPEIEVQATRAPHRDSCGQMKLGTIGVNPDLVDLTVGATRDGQNDAIERVACLAEISEVCGVGGLRERDEDEGEYSHG